MYTNIYLYTNIVTILLIVNNWKEAKYPWIDKRIKWDCTLGYYLIKQNIKPMNLKTFCQVKETSCKCLHNVLFPLYEMSRKSQLIWHKPNQYLAVCVQKSGLKFTAINFKVMLKVNFWLLDRLQHTSKGHVFQCLILINLMVCKIYFNNILKN